MFSHLDKRASPQPYCKPCGKGAHLLLHRGDIGRGERLGLGKADLPVVAHGKHPVDHAAVEVHMRIQCGAEALQRRSRWGATTSATSSITRSPAP